jgi:hypothetical protein
MSIHRDLSSSSEVDADVVYGTPPAYHPATDFMGAVVLGRDTGQAEGWMRGTT